MWLNKCVFGFIVTTLVITIHTYKIWYYIPGIEIIDNKTCGKFCPAFFEEIPSIYAHILEEKIEICKLSHFEVNTCILRNDFKLMIFVVLSKSFR